MPPFNGVFELTHALIVAFLPVLCHTTAVPLFPPSIAPTRRPSMAASFFSGAHNFSVGEMNVKNVSGDYIDHSTKNVRNTFRGGNNYYSNYDNSYHDNSRHHHGNNYTTTNYNHGPVNNIERVGNANFGNNYGWIGQNQFSGPQRNDEVQNHYHGPTTNYDTNAPGGNVVNGNFSGEQQNWQGAARQGPHPYDRWHDRGAPVGTTPKGNPSPAAPAQPASSTYAPDLGYDQQRPPPGPAPGQFTSSDPALPRQHDVQPSPKPWSNERVKTAPGRPQPNEEWEEHVNRPTAAPPAAYPPLESEPQAPLPRGPPPRVPSPSESIDTRKEGGTKVQSGKGGQRDSWPGKTYLKDTLQAHSISDSDDSSTHGGGINTDDDLDASPGDGYGAGSGRLRKEKEAKEELEATKRKEKEKEAGFDVWKGNPLLEEGDLSTSLLVSSRERLPPYASSMGPTPTPIPDSLKKQVPVPPPKPNPPSPRSAQLLAHESSRISASHERSGSVGMAVDGNTTPFIAPGVESRPSMSVDPDNREETSFSDLHGFFDSKTPPEKGVEKKKKRNALKKIAKGMFGHSSKK